MAKTSPRTDTRGFTLIELTVVITILAMFAVAIVPNLMNERRGRAIRQFFPEVRNLMMDARSRAMADGQTRTISFDEGGPRVLVEKTDPETQDTSEEKALSLPEGVTGSSFRIEKSDSTSGEWKVGFYADGKSEGGAIEFAVEGRNRTLIIDPNGTIKILEDTMPSAEDEEWDAGGYEQRV